MKRILSLILAVLLFSSALIGCSTVNELTDKAVEAAKTELEKQIQEKIKEHKVELIELKTSVGNLNSDNKLAVQFFAAILIRTESETAPGTCADALKGLGETGYMAQTAANVTHEKLVHKTITYNHTDFSAGNYYTIYVYTGSLLPT